MGQWERKNRQAIAEGMPGVVRNGDHITWPHTNPLKWSYNPILEMGKLSLRAVEYLGSCLPLSHPKIQSITKLLLPPTKYLYT